jgi:molybdopterin-binding protein
VSNRSVQRGGHKDASLAQHKTRQRPTKLPPQVPLDTVPLSRYHAPPMRLSARNRLIGKITEIHLGDVMAHVVIHVGDQIVESVITRRSADEMKLQVGDTVGAIIKSTEVMLEKA